MVNIVLFGGVKKEFALLSAFQMKHILWNFLENNNYRVSSEVKTNYGKIDLVAEKDGVFTGYEIKSFPDYKRDQTGCYLQVEKYVKSKYFDYVYLVLQKEPNEVEVGHFQYQITEVLPPKIGLILVSAKGEIEIVKIPERIAREFTPPSQKENEEWLKHQLWKHFKSLGFDVEGEVKIPKHVEEIEKIFEYKHLIPFYGNYLLSVDISLLPKEKDATFVLTNQKECDHVGIEVKWDLNKVNMDKLVLSLDRYVKSSCFTKFYLATGWKSLDTVEKIRNIRSRAFGILVYRENNGVEIIADAPKGKMEYDGFVLNGTECITVWKIGSSIPFLSFRKSSVPFLRARELNDLFSRQDFKRQFKRILIIDWPEKTVRIEGRKKV